MAVRLYISFFSIGRQQYEEQQPYQSFPEPTVRSQCDEACMSNYNCPSVRDSNIIILHLGFRHDFLGLILMDKAPQSRKTSEETLVEPLGPALKVHSGVEISHPVALTWESAYNPGPGSSGIAVTGSVRVIVKSRSFPTVPSGNGSGL